jgi:hypothetical protein
VDAVENGQFTVPINVWSEVRFAPAQVKFTSAQMHPLLGGGDKQLSLDTNVLSNLAPGHSETLKIRGVAPPHRAGEGAPDVYEFAISGVAKAGVLHPDLRIVAPKRELRVWSATPTTPPPVVAQYGGSLCELDGVAYVANPQPKGLLGAFTIVVGRGLVTRMDVNAPANSLPKALQADSESESTLKVELQTPPLDRFQEYRYRVFLTSSRAIAKADCEGWAMKLEISLE